MPCSRAERRELKIQRLETSMFYAIRNILLGIIERLKSDHDAVYTVENKRNAIGLESLDPRLLSALARFHPLQRV